MQPVIIVPGYRGSGRGHWQTYWELEVPNARRIQVPDWDAPKRVDWLRALDDAVGRAAAPPILVAHSLGCVAVAHWAGSAPHPIRGALLVAPPDLDQVACPEALRDFAPIPRRRLPFPCRVVASDNDPHAALDRVHEMAEDWSAQITVLPGAGHINLDSGFGPWREGHRWIEALARGSAPTASQTARSFAGV
jgi:predicted alpha/beta hydrolase family esterase